jgi:hypothetical protein
MTRANAKRACDPAHELELHTELAPAHRNKPIIFTGRKRATLRNLNSSPRPQTRFFENANGNVGILNFAKSPNALI